MLPRIIAFSLFFTVSGCATSGYDFHERSTHRAFSRVEVAAEEGAAVPSGFLNRLQEEASDALRAGGSLTTAGSDILLVKVRAVSVMGNATPQTLRQAGGRDAARVSLAVRAGGAETPIGETNASVIREGYELQSMSHRLEVLATTLGTKIGQKVS